MGAQVVCISRAMLTGADTIASDVAKALGHRIVDEEIVVRAAQRRNLSPAEVASVERRKSFLASMVSDITDSGADVINFIANPKVPAPTDDMRQLIREAIIETAEEGNVVIVAHAASYALARRKGVLRPGQQVAAHQRRQEPARGRRDHQGKRRRPGQLPEALLRREARVPAGLRHLPVHRLARAQPDHRADRQGGQVRPVGACLNPRRR